MQEFEGVGVCCDRRRRHHSPRRHPDYFRETRMSIIMQAIKEETTQIASLAASTVTKRTLMTEAPLVMRAEAEGMICQAPPQSTMNSDRNSSILQP